MLRIAVAADFPDAAAIAAAADVLRSGGIVAFPTDTVYGLAVDPRREDAVSALFALKGRDAAVAVPLIAADMAQAESAAFFGAAETRVAETFWPGPLSIVVPARPVVSRVALAGGSTVAIRVPSHAVARTLAAELGFCITATSANVSGSTAAESVDDVVAALPGVDAVLDGGPVAGGPPSTIVKFTDGVPVLVRAGAIAWERVLRSFR